MTASRPPCALPKPCALTVLPRSIILQDIYLHLLLISSRNLCIFTLRTTISYRIRGYLTLLIFPPFHRTLFVPTTHNLPLAIAHCIILYPFAKPSAILPYLYLRYCAIPCLPLSQ